MQRQGWWAPRALLTASYLQHEVSLLARVSGLGSCRTRDHNGAGIVCKRPPLSGAHSLFVRVQLQPRMAESMCKEQSDIHMPEPLRDFDWESIHTCKSYGGCMYAPLHSMVPLRPAQVMRDIVNEVQTSLGNSRVRQMTPTLHH
jgi:hypothetical protein